MLVTTIPLSPEFPKKCIIYRNSWKKILELTEKLEDYLESEDLLYKNDIITLVGTQTKEEKAQLIKLFVSERNEINQNANILVATSGVGNTGIDSNKVRYVARVDFPLSILDMCQEKGRAGRNPNATSDHYCYEVYYSFESSLLLFKRIVKEKNNLNSSYIEVQLDELFDAAKFLLNIK